MPTPFPATAVTRLLLLTTALLMLAGCASAPQVRTHAMPRIDFTAYQTFGWPEEVGTDRGGYETSITQYFKDAARREMEALGYRYVENDPDLLVNFFANAEEKQDVYTRASLSPGLSAGYYGYRYGMYTAWPIYTTEVDTFDYTVGTANIDLVDAAKRQMIWEGRIEGRLTAKALNDPRSAISDAVAEIFKRFPTKNPRD